MTPMKPRAYTYDDVTTPINGTGSLYDVSQREPDDPPSLWVPMGKTLLGGWKLRPIAQPPRPTLGFRRP